MNHFSLITLIIYTLAVTFNVYSFQIEEKEEIRKTLTFSNPTGRKEVVVDNIHGSIKVVGHDGHDVQLLVFKTIEGRSKEKIQVARKKVRLEISEEANTIRLYVKAPYRRSDGSVNYRGWRYYGYEVRYDFDLKVPNETNLYLKTINDGEIKVEKVRGEYYIDNINGGIKMLEVAGSGRVYALNGGVKVLFNRNPESECYFGSLNGDLEVTFMPNFSAALRLKTFNGDVYTDFPVTYLTPRKPTRKRRNGMFVYKSDRAFGVRVGTGGPEIEFDAFNGDIYIIERNK